MVLVVVSCPFWRGCDGTYTSFEIPQNVYCFCGIVVLLSFPLVVVEILVVVAVEVVIVMVLQDE